MKKWIIVVLSLLSIMLVCNVCAASDYNAAQSNEGETIAVIPYINTSEEKKDYVKQTVDAGYTDFFYDLGLGIIDPVAVRTALDNAGYDESNQMLPDKDMMAKVGNRLGADYVVAMEVNTIDARRHWSFFATKIRTNAKLKYHFYNTRTNQLTAFQTSADDNNRAVLVGDVGSRSGIVDTLNTCLRKANLKIQSFVSSEHDVDVIVTEK